MKIMVGLILSILFFILAGIHVYWGLGGKVGLDAAIPIKPNQQKAFNPGFIACIVVALGLSFLAIFILAKINTLQIALPPFIHTYGLAFLAIVFMIRAIGDFKYAGFTKKIHQGKFAHFDTRYYTPLCIGISILFLLLTYL